MAADVFFFGAFLTNAVLDSFQLAQLEMGVCAVEGMNRADLIPS